MKEWYKSCIGYQIYPSSFYDADKDGFGDIKGIISKLDYLKELGIGLIWIGPIFKSPKVDNGYDISNYYQIDESYGSLTDVKNLISKCKELNIKIIFDLVLNHTSSKHQWFLEAIKDKDSKYQDYYIFKDPIVIDGKKCPPNNWKGFFEESVWEYVESIDKYYFHIFSKEMPDLNWENPKLRQEMYQIARYWLDLGIDGFRMDAIAHLAKDQSFQSVQPLNELVLDTSKFSNRPDLFKYLREFKKEVLDHYDCVTIGEVGGEASTDEVLKYVDYQSGVFNMVFNFDTCWENGAYGSIDKSDDEIKTNVYNLKCLFKKWYDNLNGKAWMPLYWLNHDHPRLVSQYGDINYRNESAKMLATVLWFMYGTPFIYQGEEIGMSNIQTKDLKVFLDVSAKNFIKEYKNKSSEDKILRFLNRSSRDNARTVMQWDDTSQAGFSAVKTNLICNDNYIDVNVARQKDDPNSILNYYKKAISLRNNQLLDYATKGSLQFIDITNQDLFIYRKVLNDQIIILANFRNYEVSYQNIIKDCQVLLHNYEDQKIVNNHLILRPFECYLVYDKS